MSIFLCNKLLCLNEIYIYLYIWTNITRSCAAVRCRSYEETAGDCDSPSGGWHSYVLVYSTVQYVESECIVMYSNVVYFTVV